MSGATYFLRECPTCGRCLQIRVEYLGRRLVCQHCGGAFSALDSDCDLAAMSPGELLLHRADELLASIDALRIRPR